MPTRFEEIQEELRKRNAERPQSSLERSFIDLLHQCDIYEFETEYQVGTKFVDIAFLQVKLAVELDGWKYHRDRKDSDEMRQRYLEWYGWTVMRIDSREDKAPYVLKIWETVYPGKYLPYLIAFKNGIRPSRPPADRSYLDEKNYPYCIVCKRGHYVDEPCSVSSKRSFGDSGREAEA